MNTEEAKLILQAYRSGGQDAASPQFEEALAQAKNDPELARWFANEQALDAALSAKLNRSLRPPDQLKAQLLAQQKIIRPISWWQRTSVRYGSAAGLALLATVAVLWFYENRSNGFAKFGDGFDGYRAAMTDFATHKLNRLDFRSSDVAEVRRWLAENDAAADFVLPAGLNGRPSLGCRVLDWRGQKVTLVCFELANRKVAHLLVVNSSALKGAPETAPVFHQDENGATATWSGPAQTYLIVCKNAAASELQELF